MLTVLGDAYLQEESGCDHDIGADYGFVNYCGDGLGDGNFNFNGDGFGGGTGYSWDVLRHNPYIFSSNCIYTFDCTKVDLPSGDGAGDGSGYGYGSDDDDDSLALYNYENMNKKLINGIDIEELQKTKFTKQSSF